MGIERLHRCIEGERVVVDGGEVVGVDRRHDGSPGGVLAPSGERGREPLITHKCRGSRHF